MMKKKNWRYRNHETAKFEFEEKYIYLEEFFEKINSTDMSDNKDYDER